MSDPSCDVLVVGSGAAGSIAAMVLAKQGHDVQVVARGSSATALSTSRLSLSGVAGKKEVARAMVDAGRSHGLYGGGLGGREGMTNVGSTSHQDLSSPHDWCREDEGRTAVLGFRGHPDLDPDLICHVIRKHCQVADCRPYWTDPRLPVAVDAGKGPRLSEQASNTVEVLTEVISELEEDTVVIPPIFIGPSYDRAFTALERASGRAVREPATPLSNPGTRLQSCLERETIACGCHLLRDRRLIGADTDGGTAFSATIASGMREHIVRFRALVLAMGNIVGGGLQVIGRDVTEPVMGLAIDRRSARPLRSPELTRTLAAGIRNVEGRAVLGNGTVLGNVWVVGSALPGISYPLGRGLGHVVSSALSVAERVGESL